MLLTGVLLFAGCSKSNDPAVEPSSVWGKIYKEIQYTNERGTEEEQITIYSYDTQGRLLGYERKDSQGSMREAMLNSVYEGKTHTYEVHSYEWYGGSLPVVFFHTDTYADESFTILEKQNQAAKNMDFKETITYRYENGVRTGYQTVQEGTYPGTTATEITYKKGNPSQNSFPQEIENETALRDIVYVDKDGNRTGYYSDGDYQRTEWFFKYGDGFCTFYRKRVTNHVKLVRVVFYPETE